MGTSGSGKSTMMNIMGCLDQPTKGSYLLNGKDVARLSRARARRRARRMIGFVFQSFNLLSRTSALENVEMPLMYQGVPRASATSARSRRSTRVGLEDREHHHRTSSRAASSSASRSRARSSDDAPIIMADEPTGNLDTKTAYEVMAILQGLVAQGKTVILVTHEPDIAAYASRVITLRDGVIVDDKTASSRLRSRPAGARREAASPRFKLALRALWRNKVRSLLTMLGIVFGIGAVIAMVARRPGRAAGGRGRVRRDGHEPPRSSERAQPASARRGGAGSRDSLTWDDLEALENGEVPTSAGSRRCCTTKDAGRSRRGDWNTSVTGTTDVMLPDPRAGASQAGTLFDEDTTSDTPKIAVIGKTVATQLFGDGANPVGQTIRINGQPYEIIGVLESKGQSAMGDDRTTSSSSRSRPPEARRGLGKYSSSASDLRVGRERGRDHDGRAADRRARAIAQLERDRRRRLPHPQPGRVREGAADVDRAHPTLLAIVAAMSLLVGGIGVMNIMLVSVIERTREIGIRMAVGAKPIDVMTQFLVESLVLAAVGGALGVGVGLGAAALVEIFHGQAHCLHPVPRDPRLRIRLRHRTDFRLAARPQSRVPGSGRGAAIGVIA